MKAVVQRVAHARVEVDDREVSRIDSGLLILLGIGHNDGLREIEYLSRKIAELRIFADDAGKMNRSLLDTSGEILLVSQFTLQADCRRGRRPDFLAAATPEIAEPLYLQFAEALTKLGISVRTGVFGAHMRISLLNDGPVTMILEYP